MAQEAPQNKRKKCDVSENVCLLCGDEFYPNKCNKHRLFHHVNKTKSKAEHTAVLEEFVGKFHDTTRLAICGSCRTLVLRYDRVSKDTERLKWLIKDTWRKTREKRCATSSAVTSLEVKRRREGIDNTTHDDGNDGNVPASTSMTSTDISTAKEKLKTALEPLQERLKIHEEFKTTLHETAEHIVFQTQHTGLKIKEEFVKLHKILYNEEATRIKALREEEQKKSLMIKEKTGQMGREIASLSLTIRTIEEEMKAEDTLFLQNYEKTMKRTQCIFSDLEDTSGMLIDVPKHLSNLKFAALRKMQENVQYTPVTLNPNTAHCNVIVSDDLTSVRYNDEELTLPDNPDRFDMFACVLGSEGFDSGTHSWNVEVGDSTGWFLGVMTQSAQRRNKIFSRSGIWLVGHFCGEYKAHIPPQSPTFLPIKERLQRIKVQLDWDSGELSFYDSLTNIHIHSFKHRFTERLFPFFGVGCDVSSLRILPVN